MLAVGLLAPHPLLLLDEPFDGLDFRQTRGVMDVLRSYPAQDRTLFLSIHQLADAARVCDRLVLLSKGRVVGEGTLPELRTQTGLAEGGLEEIFLALT
jgi:ABC-2 type transport system ATP-binding protein